MNGLTKVLTLFMTVMISVLMMVMPVSAASMSKDGIEVTFTTNKEDYVYGELIKVDIAVLFIWWYFEFQWFVGTQIWTAFYIICIISSMRRWFRIRYYITNSGLVVKNGKTHFLLEWEEAKRYRYRVINNPLEMIFGCRTIQYAENRGYHISRGSNADLWREVTRFWCIKDYKEVNEIIVKSYNERGIK